jgi:hypothetical protein
MTPSFDDAPEPDDRPAARRTALVPYRPRPSRFGRLFRWWLGLSIAVFCLGVLCLALGLHNMDLAPLHIVIEGDDMTDGLTINGLNDAAGPLLAIGGVLVGLLAILLIPVLLLLIVGSVGIALVCGVGVPLLVLALALAVATSPFWIVGLLIWTLARRRHSRPVARSATMPA